MGINETRLNNCKTVIEKKNWFFAKTYAQKSPHEYIVVDKASEMDIFVDFFNLMEQKWFDDLYFSRVYRCVNIDWYKYWMCWSKIDKVVDQVIIINRAKLWE